MRRRRSTLSNDSEVPGSDTTPLSSTRPPDEEAETSGPPGSENGDLASVMKAYLEIFGRPPLGDHAKMDGFVAGRVLAEEYPERMQRVMSGIRQGIKEGTKAAEAAGGQADE